MDGTIKEVRIIQSDDAAGGITTWDSKTKKYLLDANTPGWQNIERAVASLSKQQSMAW